MNRKKVLIDAQWLMNGGTENVLQNLVGYLRDKDGGACYDITVVASSPKKEACALFGPEVHYVRYELVAKNHRRYTPQWFISAVNHRLHGFFIDSFLQMRHFDISIAISGGDILKHDVRIRARQKYCWIQRDYRMNRHFGIKYSFHSEEEEYNLLKKYNKVVCVSEAARLGIIETLGDPGNLCVKYNPIHVSEIRSLAQELCPLQKPPGKFLLVSVGRLHFEKQFMLLLKLYQALSEKYPLEVWIVGDGPEQEKLETYVKQENLSGVKLLGFQSNPYSYMSQADLYVSSSANEAYGLTVQESLALHVPVVAVRNSGIEESLDPRFGLLVDNDLEALEGAVRGLLEDRAQLERYRDNIVRYYPTADEMYEDRLRSICDLWE